MNFKSVRVGYVSVSLKWGDVDPRYVFGSPITGYIVGFGPVRDETALTYKTTPYQNMTVGNLTHNTAYHFRVAAMTSNRHRGVRSEKILQTTLKSKYGKLYETLKSSNYQEDQFFP